MKRKINTEARQAGKRNRETGVEQMRPSSQGEKKKKKTNRAKGPTSAAVHICQLHTNVPKVLVSSL